MAVAKDSFNITPSNTVNEPQRFRALYVGGTGTITVVNEDDTTTLFTAVPVGAIIPVEGKRVNVTGTSATLMVGLVRGSVGIVL